MASQLQGDGNEDDEEPVYARASVAVQAEVQAEVEAASHGVNPELVDAVYELARLHQAGRIRSQHDRVGRGAGVPARHPLAGQRASLQRGPTAGRGRVRLRGAR